LISTQSAGVTVARPDFFTSDKAWEKYKELKPEILEKATVFLAVISNANVKVLEGMERDTEEYCRYIDLKSELSRARGSRG
jgi:hypothetical protein